MKIKTVVGLLLLSFSAVGQTVHSPSQAVEMQFSITPAGQPSYQVLYKGQAVIKPSNLGLELKNAEPLLAGFTIQSTEETTVNETWKPVLGEDSEIKNHYHQLTVHLLQTQTNRKLNLVFKVYDEGVAFRYEFPKQSELNYFIIQDEHTQFNVSADHHAFWMPGDYDSQEYPYSHTRLSQIDNTQIEMNNGIAHKTILDRYRVQAPLQMKSDGGLYINIFEAAVINYPVMHLDFDASQLRFTSNLTPNVLGDKAYLQAPAVSPWRTIMVSDDARDIVASKLILNLNEPSQLEDTSWIKPQKYIGIWWEMHVGISTWDYEGSQNATNVIGQEQLKGRHGATTANTKRYIDFAAQHGFDGVLVEGWNEGWADWAGNWKEEVFDFVTPYPDFDLQEVNRYAKEKGVKMIMHHETSGSAANYERHLDRAFNLMKQYGYSSVKTGYVGRIIPRGEYHDGQTMVNHFHHVVKRAADYQIMVNSHESSRPTGVHRTYPNYIAAEAARGNEFNAWSIGNGTRHETILPFTRQLGGPMDYTPGIFEVKMQVYDKNKTEQIPTTLAKQLALYVTLYSPLQMAADLPENYEKYADAFQFIKDVPADWQRSIYLEAEPGEYITVARKDKQSERWFVGAITGDQARSTELKLDFLSPNKKYKAIIYQDGKNAHWKNDPINYEIKTIEVTAKSKLKLKLAPSGGTAISFEPLN